MERRAAMLNHETLREETRLEALEERLRSARTLTPDLVGKVIAEACQRLAALGTKASAVWRMIEAGALSDAMLTLIEIELPQWKPRRLVCEDGEWYCSLSKQPWLPVGFDETAEASHGIFPIAILMALIEARRRAPMRAAATGSVPNVRSAEIYAVPCDNFA